MVHINHQKIEIKKSGMSEGDIAEQVPQYSSLKSSMYREKNKNYPHNPNTFEALDFFTEKMKQYERIL